MASTSRCSPVAPWTAQRTKAAPSVSATPVTHTLYIHYIHTHTHTRATPVTHNHTQYIYTTHTHTHTCATPVTHNHTHTHTHTRSVQEILAAVINRYTHT